MTLLLSAVRHIHSLELTDLAFGFGFDFSAQNAERVARLELPIRLNMRFGFRFRQTV